MIDSVQHYLALLKKELSGCDRATIQDALADTEEHLNLALDNAMGNESLSRAEALAQVIEEYGLPEEVAAGYREIENRITPVLAVQPEPEPEPERTETRSDTPFLKRFFGVYADSRTWGSMLYLLFSLATGIIYFTWVVTGLSLSGGLLILIIGLPLAGLFLLSVRGIGLVEGLLVEALLGVRMPRRPQYSRKDLGWWQRFKDLLTDRHTWTSIIYMLLQLPLGITYFTVFTTLMALSLYLVALPVLQLGFNIPVAIVLNTTYYLVSWILPLAVIAGVLLATLTLHLAGQIGRWHGALAKTLLVRF